MTVVDRPDDREITLFRQEKYPGWKGGLHLVDFFYPDNFGGLLLTITPKPELLPAGLARTKSGLSILAGPNPFSGGENKKAHFTALWVHRLRRETGKKLLNQRGE